MGRTLTRLAFIVMCCAACATMEKTPTDARLLEAQEAFDEGQRLKEAGQYEEAVPLIERALKLREAVLGDMHLEVAHCLNLLGLVQRLKADYAHAEPLLQRALAIREAALGRDHPEVATTLNNLGTLYASQGLFAWAEPLYERALAIREAALSKDHPDLATSLYNLATLYADQGFYSRAEPLHERALTIREAVLGKNHLEVSASLRNLATLYDAQGLYARSEPLFQRALRIQEAILGDKHPGITHLLTNLATHYQAQGNYARAEPLLQRALAIDEAAFGKSHSHVAHPLNDLAVLYILQGHFARAEPLLQRSLAIEESASEKNHPRMANTLINLALLYGLQGHYARAEPLLLRAHALRETTLGKNHPGVVDSLNYLARLRLAQKRLGEALPHFERAFAASEEHLRREMFGFSEKHLASVLHLLHADEEVLYSLVRTHPEDARVRHLALSATLLRKGRSTEEVAYTSRIIFSSLRQADRETFQRLRLLRSQRAALSLSGPGPLAPADYQQRLEALADQGDALEADLAKRSAPLRALSALPPPGEIIHRVAATLPSDGALIEFVAYRDSPLVPRPGTAPSKIPSQMRYLALLLFPDGRTHALDLGPSEPIDAAALRLHGALARQAISYQAAAQALYGLAFLPLVPHLGETRRLFISSDGQLALVPFAALHDGSNFLADSLDITYLTSGKDLLPRSEDLSPMRSLVVLADPEFSSPPASPPLLPQATPAHAERSAALERFFSSPRSALADQPWPPLPGTRKEAEAIQRLLPQAQLLLGPAATKDALLTLETPGILHIATHGFFLEDAAAPASSRGVSHFGAVSDGGPQQRPPDPLLRSGLVLAGASGPAAQRSSPARGDSLITALELAGLNLWGTQLVVLSACDTGRGDIKLGQGVYGLRRALVVAGAESLVTSLWKINDETTRTLMEDYYRNLLAGMGRTTALRHAMLALRQSHPHPHFWAPFISLGKDAPLDW